MRYELGASLGTTSSFMDIGSGAIEPMQTFQLNSSRLALGTHLGYKITEGLVAKLDLNYLMLGATDSDRERQYSFMSHGFEHSLRLDVDIFRIGRKETTAAMFNKRGMINNIGRSHFYLFVGFGANLSKATVFDDGVNLIQDTDDGGTVNKRPDAHDNNFQYSPVVSSGFIFKREVTSYLDIALEVGGRYGVGKSLGWSDKIDGYSYQGKNDEGVPANKYSDRYIVVGIKTIYRFRALRNGLPDFSSIGRGGF